MSQSRVLALTLSLGLMPLAACVISVGGTSCSLHTIQGSGVAATQERQVPAFQRVQVNGSAHAIVKVGGERRVSLSGDDNLLEYVETEVRGDTLHVGLQSGSYSFRRGLTIEIQTPSLAGFTISGSSQASLSGLQGDECALSISGSGDLEATGQVERLRARISGSGTMDLAQLQARSLDADISGSGDMRVNASESLNVSISGSGDVRYQGSPQVSQHVSGSGSVGKL